MVVLNDLVHQRSEYLVRVMTSSVDTNAGVDVLATGEDCILEVKAKLVLFRGKLVKDVSC